MKGMSSMAKAQGKAKDEFEMSGSDPNTDDTEGSPS
jgi:hypothetical protein